MGNMENLESLDLGDTELTGKLPGDLQEQVDHVDVTGTDVDYQAPAKDIEEDETSRRRRSERGANERLSAGEGGLPTTVILLLVLAVVVLVGGGATCLICHLKDAKTAP